MKNYGQADKVIVDIITLDSESCAPCQYMVEAVKRIAPHFEGVVEWREHAIKKMEAVNFMSSLMVKNIPTICIDGKIAFVSKIPPERELITAVQKRINEKLKLKIKSKRSKLILIGEEANQCEELKNRVDRALTELGKEAEVKILTDRKKQANYFKKAGAMRQRLEHQIRMADIILVNKTDLVQDMDELLGEIQKINPFAEIRTTAFCNTDFKPGTAAVSKFYAETGMLT